MDADELDWADILPAAEPAALAAAAEPEPAALAERGAPAAAAIVRRRSAADMVLARHGRVPAIRKSRWLTWIPTPKRRTRDEELLAASRMRDHKALRYHRDRKVTCEKKIQEALAKLRRLGMLRDGCKTKISIARSFFTIAVPSRRTAQIPFECMAQCAFSCIQRRSDCARAFSIDPASVSRLRILVAKCGLDGDKVFMEDQAKKFADAPPELFCSGFSADCTIERLNLPFLGLEELRHITRSSWHVMVTLQRFCWSAAASRSVFEPTRPNVPLLSTETGENLEHSCYALPQVQIHFLSLPPHSNIK